ncbi:MAG TPA: right-handed parallel beta-helix repeat-containing protein, partial [Anaerovoracaceae bacterium]|nr:right-handed parallel beta-helix repeat-containing protein [Anaerovoracaceae bacterium]
VKDISFGSRLEGGSITPTFVEVRPLNTGGDDAAYVQSILAKNVGKKVYLTPGTYSWKTPCEIPSNSHLIGSPSVTIVSTIAPVDVGDPINACFYNFLVGVGSATTLSSPVVIGDNSALIVNNNVNVGDTVLLSPSGVVNVNQVLKCVAKTGSSPWRIYFDEPIEFAMNAGSQVQSITRGTNIKIEGNGMTISGTGSRVVELGAVENCIVSGINVTRDFGHFTSITMSYDIAGRNNVFRNIRIDGYGTQCGLALECNVGSAIEDCIVSGATATTAACAFYLPTSKRCRVVNCIALNSYDGFSFMYSGTGDLESCQNCVISNCQAIGMTQFGIGIHGGKNIHIDNFIANQCGVNGVALFNGLTASEEIQVNNTTVTNSGSDGFLLEGKNLLLSNCVSNSNGLAGFHIVNDGLGTISAVTISGAYATANGGAAVLHDASGARVLCSDLITNLNQGAGVRIIQPGYLFVNGWDSNDDGISGSTGVFENGSSGTLAIQNAHVKNTTSTVLWTGILDGTGEVTLTDYTCHMAGGSGVKAIIDVSGAGTFYANNVKTLVTGGTLTFGIFAGHSVACKVFFDAHCDFSAAATPLTIDATAQVGSGFNVDKSRDFEIRYPDKTSDAACFDILFKPQKPFTSATGANRTGGNFVIDLAVPTNGGTTPPAFKIKEGGTHYISAGNYNEGSGYGAYWGGTQAPSLTNFAFLGDGLTTSYFNSAGSFLEISFGGVGGTGLSLAAGSSSITSALSNFRFGTANTPFITQNDKITNGGTGATFTIQAQSETGTTSTGGSLSLFSGDGTSSAGYVRIGAGNNPLLQFSYLSNFAYVQPDPSRIGILFQNSAPGQVIEFASSTVAFFADTSLYFGDNANGNHIIDFPVNSLTDAIVSFGSLQTAVEITQTQHGSTGANPGADFIIAAQKGQNQTGFTTNNPGGDLLLKSGAQGTGGTGESQPDPSFIQFWPTGVYTVKFKNEGGFTQWKYDGYVSALDMSFDTLPGLGNNPGAIITISAQNGQNRSGGTNNNGGDISLTTGAAGTGGTGGHPGAFQVSLGDGSPVMSAVFSGITLGDTGAFDTLDLNAALTINLNMSGVTALTADNNSVQFYGGAGDGGGAFLISIADCNTPPSSNPSGGGIMYAQGGALKWRGSSGTITTIAPA